MENLLEKYVTKIDTKKTEKEQKLLYLIFNTYKYLLKLYLILIIFNTLILINTYKNIFL